MRASQRFVSDPGTVTVRPPIMPFCGAAEHASLLLAASRPDRSMDLAVVSDRVVIPSQLTSMLGFVRVLGLIIKFRLDGIIVNSPHVCSALSPVSLLTRLLYYGSPAESVPAPGPPIPSFDCRKSKCRKDVNFAASLRHHRESQGL